MFKKLLSLSLCLVLLLCSASVINVQATANDPSAAEEAPVISRLAYTKNTRTSLSISSSGVATLTAEFTGYSGTTTKVVIALTLEKQNTNGSWYTVISWQSTYNSYSATMIKTYNVSSGLYRAKAVYTAYSGSSTETTTQYSGTVRR